jgi:ribosome biogenesis protein Nip4
MNDVKSFRRTNEIEQEIIRSSLGKISKVALSALAKSNHELYIAERSSRERYFYPKIFLIPNNLSELVSRSKSIVYSAGLYFGFIKKGEFLISLEGTFFLHERGCFSKEQHIHVNEKGEKSILYGNKVLKSMISSVPPNLKKNTFILVFNGQNEFIAIGQTQVDGETIQSLDNGDIIALNLVDKGYYLRKQ